MREKELLLYRGFENAEIFRKMTQVIDEGMKELSDNVADPGSEHIRDELYECIHLLLEQAGEDGFYGNLWHDYLTGILVNHENSYSVACEMRGSVKGTVNDAALHDIGIFKEYFDFDFTKIIEGFDVPSFRLVLNYEQAGVQATGGEAAGTDSDASLGTAGGETAGTGLNAALHTKDGGTAAEALQGGIRYNRRIRDRICELAKAFEQADSAEEMKDLLTDFYAKYGVGKFGLHKAFHVVHDETGPHAGETRIEPIRNILHVSLDDLVGYETAKKKLTANTDAFVSGRPANNVLLYGEAGTGKSSSIKAIANEYYEKGLRIIEVNRYQFRDLDNVIAGIKNRNYWFILYMDDLSFEENETEYKYLKAVIEGGLEKKPSNVLIYATSNRQHLIRESFHDRDGSGASFSAGSGGSGVYGGTGPLAGTGTYVSDDVPAPGGDDKHYADTVQEKLSLANRFGVTIYYGAPDYQEYLTIVSELAERNGITMGEKELRQQATRWEMTHGGLSGRTASQFIDWLLGTAQR